MILPSSLITFFQGVAGLVPNCARRTTTASSWGFREHGGPTVHPSSLLANFFSILLIDQMMVERIANQFGGGGELQLIQEAASIGTDGLDAENEGLRDVLERLALGY